MEGRSAGAVRQIQQRKELYEAKHPETRHGGKIGKASGKGRPIEVADSVTSIPSFVDSTAKVTGRSPTVIREDTRIASGPLIKPPLLR